MDVHTATRVQRQAKLQSGLQESLITIVRLVNEKRDHIPPVVTTGPLTFPFDITTAGSVLLHVLLRVVLYAHCVLMLVFPLLGLYNVCIIINIRYSCPTLRYWSTPWRRRDAASGFGLDSFRRMLTQMQTTPPPMLS